MKLEHAIGFKKQIIHHEPNDALPLPTELMGIELEYEQIPNPMWEESPDLWTVVNDGSLRDGGREYIFHDALYGTGVTDALSNMTDFLQRAQPVVSERCSVHVHINVSDMDVDQFLSLIVLYLIFEKSIIKYHKGTREDNIFCIPYYRAPEPLGLLVNMYQSIMAGVPLDNGVVNRTMRGFAKYYGLNIGAVVEHGSLEFRHMAGTMDMSEVFNWVCIIQCLKKAALDRDTDYMGMIHSMSGNTSTIVNDVFKEYAGLFTYPDMSQDLLDGARLAQKVVGGVHISHAIQQETNRSRNTKTNEKIRTLREKITGKVDDMPGTITIPDEIAAPIDVTTGEAPYNMQQFMQMMNDRGQL